MKKNSEFLNLFFSFFESFELVFRDDWDFTKDILSNKDGLHGYINSNGSFISPEIDDEYNNWKNRGHLLAAYRELKEYIEKNLDIKE